MRFSVIIPLYNKSAYIKNALQSVFAQTFTDHELIVVDDGSKDDSCEIVKKYLKENGDERCRLIHQDNTGVSTARNNGVAASHGEYICFLDADDWWEPTFLDEMDCLITEFPDAGIYGTSYYIVKNGNNRIAPIAFDGGFEKGYINYVDVYSKYLCMPLWTGAVSLKRTVFDEMGGFKPHLKLGEDFDLWLRIALKYKVAMVNKPLTYYNQDVPVNLRATRNLHKPEETEYILYQQYEQDNPDNESLKKLLDRKRVDAMMDYHLSDEYGDFARKELDSVDWTKQSKSVQKLYKKPKWFLKTKHSLFRFGSRVKTFGIRIRKSIIG